MNKVLINANQLNKEDYSDKKQTQFLKPEPKNTQRKMTDRFQKITEDLDRSFNTRKEEIEKINLNKSKVQRKDTKQSQHQSAGTNPKNQQLSKNQPMNDMIQKSETDPFMRRKLKAVMQNDLKSLKKLNDQKSKPSFLSKTSITSLNYIPNNVTDKNEVLDNEYTRIPKDIGKILESNMSSKNEKNNLRKMNSQPFLINFKPNKLYHKLTLPQHHQEIKVESSFTTLRKQSYKNTVQALEKLREINEESQDKPRQV